jgi:CAAX prenyl protease-like protein
VSHSRAVTASPARNPLLAQVLPFGLFMLGLAAVQFVQWQFGGDGAPLFLREPMYWIYPLQTLACGAALVWFWKAYAFGSAKPLTLAVPIGLVVFVVWVSPQLIFGQPPRRDGFDPEVFADDRALYLGTLAARFLRLVVVVPLVEEIFWRGFLQRYLINEDFTKIPFGTYTPFSFWFVTAAFASVHWGPDFIPALITGAIYGFIAIRTKSLLACVVAHAVTNLALGIYVLATKQWGFW